MILTYQYRLLPTKAQLTKLNQTLELCRWVYNESLAARKNAWEQEQNTLSCYDTFRMIPIALLCKEKPKNECKRIQHSKG